MELLLFLLGPIVLLIGTIYFFATRARAPWRLWAGIIFLILFILLMIPALPIMALFLMLITGGDFS